MWINRIELTNWRAYEHAVFNIPRPQNAKNNVVLIGAKNGVGKTSLLEAVTLCLFGEDGLGSLGRGRSGNAKLPYGDFLRGAFYGLADQSSPKASATVTFAMEGGGQVSVERTWHFKANRDFREEYLRILKDDSHIEVPALADLVDRAAFLRGYVAENFLPPSLSPFFLFDAARVQQMARSDMKAQVRDGIEAILGVPVIKEVIRDLHDYAGQRYKKATSGRATDSKMDELQKGIDKGESESKRLSDEINDVENRLKRAKEEDEALMQRYESMGGDDAAGVLELREKQGRLEQNQNELSDALTKSLIGDFAMSLASPDMLGAAVSRLCAEKSRLDWERDKKKGAESYDKFIGNLEKSKALVLPLSDDQLSALRDNIKTAWDNVWYPMPDECAEEILTALSEEERADAIARLESLTNNFGTAGLKDMLDKIERNKNELSVIKQQIDDVRGARTEEARQLKNQLRDKRDEIAGLEKKKGDCAREKVSVDAELARVRQEWSREVKQREGQAPVMRLSARAESAASAMDDIVKKSYSRHVSNIAQGMTDAFVAMAHKGDSISEIHIENDCEIKVMTPEGRNLREFVPSHGESEIFSLALIAAIARVAENQFPFIVDTPLANLDKRHQREFLRYFSSDMDNQIILLSTDAEIRDEHMGIIRRRVAGKFLVEQEMRDGVGRNIVRPGQYFGEQEE